MIERKQEFNDSTLGSIVSLDYRKSRALASLGVDYSCNGSRTLKQVFKDNDDGLKQVISEWQKIDLEVTKKGLDYMGWGIDFLANYIVQLHHHYVHTQTPFITELALKVAESNFSRNPEIKVIADLFKAMGQSLGFKGKSEESTLFPYIISLNEAMLKGTVLNAPPFGSVKVPIAEVKREGKQIVASLHEIRRLSHNYVAPSYTTSTCPILYKMLANYEEDTLLHLHLENNILFSKAIKTEEYLRANHQII